MLYTLTGKLMGVLTEAERCLEVGLVNPDLMNPDLNPDLNSDLNAQPHRLSEFQWALGCPEAEGCLLGSPKYHPRHQLPPSALAHR